MAEHAPAAKDIQSEDALRALFAPSALTHLLARIVKEREDHNLIAHPLQAPILIAYADDLAALLSELVPSGRWSPSRAYECLSLKRSGGYRELVFPGLIDAVVGRCIIDALEPHITSDDGNRCFCGRSHASSNQAPGDYERWFSMWQNYSAQIATAALEAGFTYVFDTDVADFFPSIDRTRAREFLASRTNAHASVLSLLFSCLEAWLPRVNYTPMTGIPIENNDISRLVAHNYLKQVDRAFVERPDCKYLRYVDDTVIFATSKNAAQELKRRHHLALRAIGLNPNAAKSSIEETRVFEGKRHRAFNQRIDQVDSTMNITAFDALVDEWLSQPWLDGWEHVMRRLYATGKRLRSPHIRGAVADHVKSPTLAEAALKYLARFDVTTEEAAHLLQTVKTGAVTVDVDVMLARFFGDAVFADGNQLSNDIANMAVLRIMRDATAHELGHVRGLWLLVLHKHGRRAERDRVREWTSALLNTLVDEQFRLHFMYVFTSVDELPEELRRRMRHLASSDIELTMRCCEDAASGTLGRRDKVLNRVARRVNGRRTISCRYLPLLRLIMKAQPMRDDNIRWLRRQLDERRAPECTVVAGLLKRWLEDLSR